MTSDINARVERLAAVSRERTAGQNARNRERFPAIAAWADDFRAVFGAGIRVGAVWSLDTGETLYGQRLPEGVVLSETPVRPTKRVVGRLKR